MPGKSKNEFSFEITEELGVIWESDKGGIQIEVNMISYNGDEPKLDIRKWSYNRNDERVMQKGIALSDEAVNELAKILIERGYDVDKPKKKDKKDTKKKSKKSRSDDDEDYDN